MHTPAEIEDAIVAALEASELGTICKSIKSYQGEIDDLIDKLKQSTVAMPAVFVLYSGSKFTQVGAYSEDPTFTAVFVTKDLRGSDARRAGMYEMLEIGKTTLINQSLGFNDIQLLAPLKIEAILTTQQYSVYAFDVETSFTRE